MHTESRLEEILLRFWAWAEYDSESFAEDGFTCPDEKEPFYFPGIEEMRNLCCALETNPGTNEEIQDYLTCMALDNEEEGILDHCAAHAPDAFVECLASAALVHPQWNARWQIAELLGRRNVPGCEGALQMLTMDPHPYVRRRAENAIKNIEIV